MNVILAAIAVLLSVLIVPLGNDLVVVAAAIAWGMALFAMASDAIDLEDQPLVLSLLVFGMVLTGVFAAMAGLLGFMVSTTAFLLSALCIWQRQRLISTLPIAKR